MNRIMAYPRLWPSIYRNSRDFAKDRTVIAPCLFSLALQAFRKTRSGGIFHRRLSGKFPFLNG